MSTKELTKTQADLAINPAINSLAQSSMFWRPDYLRSSPWLEHVPFLFWLVEAHQPRMAVTLGTATGVAHFALCQAVQRLRLETRCYFTSRGLDEAESSLLREIKDYHDSRFDSFSYLLEGASTRAASQFEEGSVDLLLLNPGADEDLEGLLMRWQPKLSSRCLVLLPGVAHRGVGCEAFTAFDALARQHPSFAFHHGGGLGAVSVGSELGPLLSNLFDREEPGSARQVVRDVFGRLGRTCKDALQAREYLEKAEVLEARLGEQKRELDQLSADYESTRTELESKQQELAGFGQRMEQAVERHARERGQLTERVRMLQEFRDDLKAEAGQLRQRLDEQYRQVNERNLQLLQSQASSAEQLRELVMSHGRAEVNAGELQQQLIARDEALEDIEQKLAEQQSTLAKREEALSTQKILNDVLKSELAEKEQQLQRAESRAEEPGQKLTHLERRVEDRERANRELEEQVRLKEEALAGAQASLEDRYRELAALTELLEEGGQKRADRETPEGESERESAARIHQLESTAVDLERQLQQLRQSKQDSDKAREELSSRNASLEKRLESVEQERDSLKEDRLHILRRVQVLESDLSDGRSSLDERFRELALLTRMLEAKDAEITALRVDAGLEIEEAAAGENLSSKKHGLPVSVPFGKRAKKLRKQRKELEQIKQSGLFDAEWYLRSYPDVAEDRATASNPALHYLKFGAFEGRNPGPGFDSQWYLDANPDVRDSGFNPLVHYVSMGRVEGRPPLPR